jgi:hypothetical protein
MVWRASINPKSCMRIALAVMPAQAGIQFSKTVPDCACCSGMSGMKAVLCRATDVRKRNDGRVV